MAESSPDTPSSLLPALREELGDEAAGVSDSTLLKFLGWKPSVGRAAERFRAHRTWRASNPFAFDDPARPLRVGKDPELGRVLGSDFLVAPDGMTAMDGSSVMVGRLRKNDLSDGRTVEDVVRAILYTIDRVVEREGPAGEGMTVFHDLSGLSTNNVSPMIPRILLPALVGNLPIKIRGIYLLHAPFFFRVLFKGVSLMLPSKLKSRIHFVDSLEEVHAAIEQEQLLEEHGGKRTYSSKDWIDAQEKREEDGTLESLSDCYVSEST